MVLKMNDKDIFSAGCMNGDIQFKIQEITHAIDRILFEIQIVLRVVVI
jgi:hypothetical protein